ncbi:MAG: hypothetical protein AAFY17_13910, partial [Cyanobacteria bacterium J06642_11]
VVQAQWHSAMPLTKSAWELKHHQSDLVVFGVGYLGCHPLKVSQFQPIGHDPTRFITNYPAYSCFLDHISAMF